MRIKFIIPFPFDEEGIANRAAQIPADLLGPETHVECVPVRNSATLVDCHYEALVFDMYITEAGLRAEDEGYDAVIMDTVSDSGLSALRSRLALYDLNRLQKISAVRSSVFVYFEWFLRDIYGVKVVPAETFTRGLVDRGIISLGFG